MLLAAVALLLALVLFNMGNLLLTRNANRLREYVVREALGATSWRLFRQSFAEQVLIVAAAAAVSLVLTLWSISAVRSLAGQHLPRLYDLSLDLQAGAILPLLSFLIALVFGALPLLVRRGAAMCPVLQSEGRSLTSDRRTNRLKSGLMVLEIGASMALLVGAGLLAESFRNVMRVDPGFDPSNLLNLTVSLNPKTNENAAKRLTHVRELLDAFRSIPGVESASVVNHVPLTGESDISAAYAADRPRLSGAEAEGAEYRVVDASYFRTMRIPVVLGREFREDEPAGFSVINQKMAARLWPGENPIEKKFSRGDSPPVTVVGVVGDVHDGSLERPPRMQFYMPLAANPRSDQFMIRTRVDPEVILPLAEKVVGRLDPEQPVSHPQTMDRL